jgi:hypothetical protein
VARAFVRRRDGRIEVKLSDVGRQFVHEQFARLRLVDEDPNSPWRGTLSGPIDPTLDVDDPVRMLERQGAINQSAELALVTENEQFLSPGEAWAWLTALQLALRATAALEGLATEMDVKAKSSQDLVVVHNLQSLLFDLSEALS